MLPLSRSPYNEDSKKLKDSKTKSKSWAKRRIDSIKEINRNINLVTTHKNGEVKSKRKVEKLYENFMIHQKGLRRVLEEFKQRVLANSSKNRDLQ